MRTLRLALAQINSAVGDLDGNTRKIIEQVEAARSLKADLVAFPELAVPGYPPEDLLFKSQFIQANIAKMHQVVGASSGIAVVVGFADADTAVYNAAAVAFDGHLVGIYHKMVLPNYGVFDEERYFNAGTDCPIYVIGGSQVGVNVCEDIWNRQGPTIAQRRAGAGLIVNISASPFHAGKRHSRDEILATRAMENGVFVAYVNLVGGQDELVFDGASVILDPAGKVVARGRQFQEDLVVADLPVESLVASRARHADPNIQPKGLTSGSVAIPVSDATSNSRSPLPVRPEPDLYDDDGEVYAALVTGTRDYVHKCGFDRVLIALSGGIDSSLVAAIAVDALGPENVMGVAMPSRYSSEGSLLDAMELADNLRIELRTVAIEDAFSAHLDTLAPYFKGTETGVAEENLQSRIRGVLIMALSNKHGWLVLTTGNKSEMAVGYATMYGDMAGGYAVIKDVPKTLVYRLAEHRNAQSPGNVIPQSIIEKAPSAELRPNQRDEDNLPPYAVLDPILKAYAEDDLSFDEIVDMGFGQETVKLVIAMVDSSEHKRRQAPPGIKITPRNFGRDRRMPVANRYRPY